MEMSKLLSAANSLLPHNDQFDIWNAMLQLEQLNVGSGAGAFRYDLSGHECIGRFKSQLQSDIPRRVFCLSYAYDVLAMYIIVTKCAEQPVLEVSFYLSLPGKQTLDIPGAPKALV